MVTRKSGKDIQAIRESITHGGEFRVHLMRSRSGLRTVCRMWHPDGYVMGTANGGGYDKAGAALGQCIEALFLEELKGLTPGYVSYPSGGQRNPEGLYGLTKFPAQEGRISLDGSCGLECMLTVLRALGFTDCEQYNTGKLSRMVLARKPRKKG